MRPAHSCLFLAFMMTAAAVTFASAASAQPHHPAHSDALDPQAPTLPLAHQALRPSGDIVPQPGSWAAANQAVAEFPRGHADLIQWEARQPPSSNAPAAQPATGASKPMTMPAHSHQHHQPHQLHHHGGKP